MKRILLLTLFSALISFSAQAAAAVGAISGRTHLCVGTTDTLRDTTSGGIWSSAHSTIAIIGSGTGIVIGVTAGVDSITYYVSGRGSVVAVITVNPLPKTIRGRSTICAGTLDTLQDSTSGGTWSTTSSNIFVNSTNGLVTGYSAGPATVTYTTPGGCTALFVLTVDPLPTVSGPTTVYTGGTIPLTGSPSGGTWSSSNTSVATIGTGGVVTGVSTGYTYITYTSPAGCDTVIFVTDSSSAYVAGITGSSTVCTGNSIVLSDSTTGGAWSSSNPLVATVGSTGIVTGVSSGVVTITYTAGSGFVVKTVTVNPAASISGPSGICIGSTITLTGTPSGGTWSSGSLSIATVASGVVTGVAAGSVNIYYAAGGCYAYHTVTVSAVPAAITGTTSVTTGGTTTLHDAVSGGTWSSSNTSIATVNASTGVVTGVSAGTCTVTYNTGGCYVVTTVTVTGSVVIDSITGPSSVCVGSTITLADGTSGGTWTSSNTAIATVSSAGVVTGINAGPVYITYTVGTGHVTKIVSVNTLPAAITISPTISVGGTTTITDATSGGTWSSSNTSIATINPTSGLVTGVSAGTCTITYTLPTGCFVVTTVTVTGTSISSITGATSVCSGSTITLFDSTSGGTWSTGSTNITVGSLTGVVTGISAGTATVTYTVGSSHVTITITVNPLPAAITGTTTVSVGGTTTLTDASGSGTWTSSNTSIATINATSGLVTGVSAGTCTITYTLPTGCFVVTTVTVTGTTSISSITGPPSVCVGSTITLSDSTSGGTWSTSSSTATVGSISGIVTGLSTGFATITYTVGSSHVTTTISVEPMPAAITGTTTVSVGGTTTLSDASSGGGGTWTSSNTSIATVNATSGLVTGVSAGTCTITFALPTGCFVTTTVTVTGGSISSIIGPSTMCVGSTINLFDTTSGGTWSTGSTNITVGSSTGIVTGISAGTAIVTYTVGASHVTWTITVDPLPAAITGTTTVSAGGTTTLSDASGGGTWSSSNTSIATVNVTSGVVTGVSAGTCTITYSLPTGCFVTTTVTVTGTVSISPITGPTVVCVGSTITLADATAGGTWSSSNTLIATVSATTGNVTGLSSGTVTITYTVGSSHVTYTVTVTSGATITGSSTVCAGSTTTLTASVSGGTWISGDTAIATVNTGGVVTGLASGVVNIYYSVGGCYAYHTVTVNAMPTISGTSTLCTGTTATMTGSPSGGTWSSGNTSVATVSSTGVVTAVGSGLTNIYYTVGGCTTYHTVTVNAAATISGGSILCAGSTTTLTASISGGIWASGDTLIATVSSTGVVTAVSSGVVTIYYYLGSCYTAHTVTVNATAVISGSNVLCGTSPITLTASISGGTWSSGNTSIAIVSSSGVVTPVSSGVVNIYYLSGGCYASYTVTVTATASISGSSDVCIGSTTTLSATPPGGSWSSSNTALATVNSSGVVTGVGSGVVNIYYTAGGGCGTYHIMTVNAMASISGPSTLCAGSTITLTASPSGGTWSSGNTAVATVSSAGVVTGVAGGPVGIYYNTSGCSAYLIVTVNPSATISGNSTLCIGSTCSLGASISGGTWSSSNTSVATVTSTGIVAGVSAGVVNIYYLSGGCYSYHTMTINAVPTISGASTMCSGSTTTLTGSPSGGIWLSTDTLAATISSTGVVTALTGGTVTFYYTVGGCSATHTITISSVATISGGSSTCIGSTIALSASVSGGTWSSGNTSIATVNSSGIVTGVAGGVVNIYYTIGGCAAYHTVTVNAAAAITGSTVVCIGNTIALTATPPGGTWSSGNTAIATVSSSGVVTGMGAGVVNIYYSSGGCYAYHTVTVNAVTATISGSTSLCAGSSITLVGTPSGGSWSSSFTVSATITSSGVLSGVSAGTSTIYYSVGGCYAYRVETVDPLPEAISGSSSVCVGSSITLTDGTAGGTWSSSSTSIASVTTTGVVTGVSAGIATISYSTGACSATKSVTVDAAPASITGGSSVAVGHTLSLSDAVSGGTWLSGNTTIASVNPFTGVVTGVSTGTVNIYYSIGSCTVYETITVTSTPEAPIGSQGTGARSSISGSDNSIQIYPNPTNGILNIQWDGQEDGAATVVVTDITGREAYRSDMEISTASGQKQFDLSNLKNGVYIITIKSDGIYYNARLVINK